MRPGGRGLRILHAIHDYLPRHRAGSEIYAASLCRALAGRHHVSVLAAEYDPGRRHGSLRWRLHDHLPVIEIVNNWQVRSFEETYRSPLLGRVLDHALRAARPDVLHIHSLLNLSFELPLLARARGIPVVATLHDHSLVCPSGGQRLHAAEDHVCREIDVERCARCFRESPFYAQALAGRLAPRPARCVRAVACFVGSRFPGLLAAARARAPSVPGVSVSGPDITARLAFARRVFDEVDVFVAPSRALADAFVALGLSAAKIRVSPNGHDPLVPLPRLPNGGRLRLGFVGTLVRHKGVHVLLDALRLLPAGGLDLSVFGALDTFPDYVALLRRKAAGLSVTFHGAFAPEAAAQVYAGFDVLVVPSIWPENSPLVIHEAFMAGLPVVGARIGGIPELVDDGVNGMLYDPASPAALAAALGRLLERPAEVDRLRAGLPRVKTMAEDAAGWERTYGELVHAGAARAVDAGQA